eukprot:5865717-Pyramimonas_sp.AAC.1
MHEITLFVPAIATGQRRSSRGGGPACGRLRTHPMVAVAREAHGDLPRCVSYTGRCSRVAHAHALVVGLPSDSLAQGCWEAPQTPGAGPLRELVRDMVV